MNIYFYKKMFSGSLFWKRNLWNNSQQYINFFENEKYNLLYILHQDKLHRQSLISYDMTCKIISKCYANHLNYTSELFCLFFYKISNTNI